MSEIVLADGRFAAVRPITVMDMLHATKLPPGIGTMAALCARCATLDGQEVPVDEWLAMEYGYVLPVFEQLAKQLEAAFKMREGVV